MSEFTGIFISKEILEIPNLPFFHKGVLAQIVALSKTDGYCRATDGYLARLFQVERSNINRTINKLFASGYVHIDTDPKSGNKRTITPIINSTQPLYQNDTTPCINSTQPLYQNDTTPCINSTQPLYQNDTTPCINSTQPLYQNDTTPCINSTQPLYQNDTTIYNDESKEESKVLNQRLNDHDSGEENFSNNSSIPLEEKGETPPKAPPVPAAPNFNSSQEHGGGAKDNVTIQLWRENVKYTASMTIGDLKDIGFVDFATSRQGERSKLLPIIKNSLSSLVRKWLTNINWQQSIKAPMSTSFAESAVESLSGTSIPVLREKLLDESSYSIQLLINQQIVWDGNVQFVEQKVESRLFSTLTALYPEKMEESTWQEICKYFAPIATSAKPTASQVGPQTNNPPPKGLKAQVAEAAKYTEHPFSEDELFDPVKFAALIEEKNAKLDSDYYYMAVTGWRDKYGKPPQRKVWASVINQFILNDHKKGTLQFKTNNATSNANPAPPVRNSRLKPVGIEPSEQGREFGSW